MPLLAIVTVLPTCTLPPSAPLPPSQLPSSPPPPTLISLATAPPVTSKTPELTCNPGSAWPPSATLAFADADGLRIISTPGASTTQLTHNPGDGAPAWSPDGDSLAYYSNISSETGNTDLFLIAPDGNGPTRLTRTQLTELYPVWSSDGRYIAFEAQVWPPEGEPHVELRFYDTSTAITQIAPSVDRYNTKPMWSPASHKIAFLSSPTPGASSGSNLHVFDIDAWKTTQLTFDSMVDEASWPHWSPNGKTILVAIGSTASLASNLALVDVATGSLTTITQHAKGYGQAQWSPDGTKIAFSSIVDGRGSINALDLLTRSIHSIVQDPSLHADVPLWSPDGSVLAFVYTTFDPARTGNLKYGRGMGIGLATLDGCLTLLPIDSFPGGVRLAPTQAWRPVNP